MHRAVGRYQGWKISTYLVGLDCGPWTHLSDASGSFIQGISCAKSPIFGVNTKYFYPMECTVYRASIPGSRTNVRLIAEEKRLMSSASLQSGRNLKGKLVNRKAQGGRYLSSRRLLESAYQVLRDFRNEKFSLGIFRVGSLVATDDNLLISNAQKQLAEEFEWSSALWEAEISNADDGMWMRGTSMLTEINHPADKLLNSSNGTQIGTVASEAVGDGDPVPLLCNAPQTQVRDGTTAAASVVMDPSNPTQPNISIIREAEDNTAPTDGLVKEDVSDLKVGASCHSSDIEHIVEEEVIPFSQESSEVGGVVFKETNGESNTPSDSVETEQIGGIEKVEMMERLRKLRSAVAYHAYQYNTLDNPVISDSAYDALVKELEEVQVSTLGKHELPSSTVGAPPSPSLLKVQHSVPMLSLASVQKEEELLLWYQRLQQKLGPDQESLQWVVEPKVDGLALSLRYEDGKLVRACTRGNGFEGEDVTHNAQNVKNIPSRIPQEFSGSNLPLSVLEVRGEIYMPLEHFKELNAAKLQSGEKPFANPRNAAAGSMRLLSSPRLDHRPLSFMAYNIANIEFAGSDKYKIDSSPAQSSSQWEALQLLKSLGFSVNEDNQIFNTFDSALEYGKSWMNKRQSLEYEADGVVFKINNLGTQVSLGDIGGDPRWAVAWKFTATEVVTVLEAIELSVGRSGVIVPNARLRPVELGGVNIRRATLHNFKHVKSLGLCEGDHIIVQRAGDVIPQVVQALRELRLSGAQPWLPPTQCPSCGSELREDPGKAMVFCQNSSCSSRVSRQVEHFANTLIHGLGPKILALLQEEGLVVDPADLYSLDQQKLSNLPRLGKKSAKKLHSAIEESKHKPDWEFIAALGIPRVGKGAAQRLDKHFGGLRGLIRANDDELTNVPGVGEQTLNAVLDWCRSESNITLVNKLVAAGCARASILPAPTKNQNTLETAIDSGKESFGTAADEELDTLEESILTGEVHEGTQATADSEDIQPTLLGKTVVITGNFRSKDRESMRRLVESHGAKVRTTVTSKTSFVLAGEKPGPNKIDTSKQLGIEVLDWDKFQTLIKRH